MRGIYGGNLFGAVNAQNIDTNIMRIRLCRMRMDAAGM
jgi:hypothetical protein